VMTLDVSASSLRFFSFCIVKNFKNGVGVSSCDRSPILQFVW